MVAFTLGAATALAPAAKPALPPPAAHRVDFAREVKPIFEASCIRCHARGREQGGFSLETPAKLLAGGDTGGAIEPRDSSQSYLISLVAGTDPDLVMPQKGSRLTPRQVGILRAWIDQGLEWPKDLTFERPPPRNLVPHSPAIPAGDPAENPIDRFLRPYFAAHGTTPGRPVGDRIFARRAYLAVVGLLPSPEQVAAFASDPAPDKRARLIGRLLADNANYAQNWISFWDDLLRNSYKGAGNRRPISRWLYRSLTDNLPYDRMVSQLLDPTPATAGFTGGIVWRGVINASETPPMQAAQNISQVFLGVNLKCASCHDSFVNDLTLADAYGMAGIYAGHPLEMVRCDKPLGKTAQLAFLYPQLGRIDPEADSATRIRQFTALMVSAANGRFTRTLVNRYWQRLMGRGLVAAVDDMEQPSWNSDLLDWLAQDFAAHHYDLKHLLEQIMTSRAFSLPAVAVDEKATAAWVFHGPQVGRMTAEQYSDAVSQLTGEWYRLPDAVVDLAPGATPPSPSAADDVLVVPARQTGAVKAGGKPIPKSRIHAFGTWAVLDLQGLKAITKPAAIPDQPRSAAGQQDYAAAQSAAAQAGHIRSSLVEATKFQLALDRPTRDQVVTVRSSVATTLQALEFTNGPELASRLDRGAARLIARYGADPRVLTREVYLLALGRPPSPAEARLAAASLGDPAQAASVSDLLWAVSMLPEFQLIY